MCRCEECDKSFDNGGRCPYSILSDGGEWDNYECNSFYPFLEAYDLCDMFNISIGVKGDNYNQDDYLEDLECEEAYEEINYYT